MPMIIPDDPSGSVWTDGAPNVSRQDPTSAVQFDAEHLARNRKVVGSNPTSGSETAGQSMCGGPSPALLASLIILMRESGLGGSRPWLM
jgi:hypothetical protein